MENRVSKQIRDGVTMKMRRGKIIALATGVGVLAVVLLMGVYWRDISAWAKFIYLFESIGRNEQGYPEYRHRQTGIVMVRVPGGTFMMGSPGDEVGRLSGEDLHAVTLSPFLIARYEVTEAQWQKVMGGTPSDFKEATLPVVGVSWQDCTEFLRKTELSLPTEAQWEYAARAGKTGRFTGTGQLEDMGWYGKNSQQRVHPVGEKEPNAFGLYDIHGNIREWCEDAYDKDFYSKPEASTKDSVCSSHSKHHSGYRVARGGSWIDTDCRLALRVAHLESDRFGNVGFRPSCRLP